MQKHHQNDIRRTVPEGLRPTAQRKGQTNEKTQAKYGGARVRQPDPVLWTKESRRTGQGRGAQGHTHGRDRLQPEKVPQERGRETLHWYFKDHYEGPTSQPDCFLPANPTKTGSRKDSLKTA